MTGDIALILLAVAYTRLNGWGSISGLMTGLFLAMSPWSLDEGWRADGTALLAPLALVALLFLRRGLRAGTVWPALVSASVLGLMTVLSPVSLLLVPAGLYAASRSVTGAWPRNAVWIGWLVAGGAGLAARQLMFGNIEAGLGLSQYWLADEVLGAGRVGLPSEPLLAFGQALATVSASGPFGDLAHLLQVQEAPLWRLVLGMLLWPMVFIGFFGGLVQADQVIAQGAPASPASGAGARDGWRSLGVAVSSAPRSLGERDLMPLLLVVLGAAGWVAWAAHQGDPRGVTEALALARPCAALMLGVGLTGFAMRFDDGDPAQVRKRFVLIMVSLAMVQFGLGAHHVFEGTQRIDRIAATKVARFAASEMAGGGTALCLGPGGLTVIGVLDVGNRNPRVQVSSVAPKTASAQLAKMLSARPPTLVIAGDRLAVDGDPSANDVGGGALGAALHRQMRAAGYDLGEDGHRYLGSLSVRSYQREQASDSRQIRPQLYPGKAP